MTDHTDVERLWNQAIYIVRDGGYCPSREEKREQSEAISRAAEATQTMCAEITRLRAEAEALRKALEIIAGQHSGRVASTARSDCMASIARAALDATKGTT